MPEDPTRPREGQNWTLTWETFQERYRQDPRRLFETLYAAAIERDDLLEQNLRFEERITTLEGQLAEAVDERDEYRVAYAALAREHHAERRSSTPTENPRRSMKLPDPPMLTDGREPKFENWLSKMKGKLEGNADHYTTEALKMAYINSRTEGEASDHLKPRLRDDSPNKFQTAIEMLNYLEGIYRDPNQLQDAKTEFRRLRMHRTDDFHQFLTRFLHLAGESKLPETEYKYELNEKLLFDLQKLVIAEYNSQSTFDAFSKHCSRAAHTLKKINDAQARISRMHRTPTQEASKPAATRPSHTSMDRLPTTKRLTDSKTARCLREGRCFKCDEVGHLARFCSVTQTANILPEELKTIQNEDSGKELP